MCNSAPAAPPQPDYVGAAQAQGQANVDAARATAKLNNPNIIGPYGTQTVTYGTGDQQDIPTVTQTLTPTGQQTIDQQQQVQLALSKLAGQGVGTAQNVLGTAFNPNLPNMQTSLDTSGVAKLPVNAGTTGQQAIMERLQPQIDQSNAALDQQLANQGITPGSEAYNNAKRVQNQSNNDLYTQAALQGINLDQTNNQIGYNEALQSGQFGNQSISNSLQEQLALRNQPLNEITGLMSGSQIQTPQFQQYQGANIQAAPIFNAAQAQGNAALQNYGIGTSAANANTSGLYGLAGSGLMAGALLL